MVEEEKPKVEKPKIVEVTVAEVAKATEKPKATEEPKAEVAVVAEEPKPEPVVKPPEPEPKPVEKPTEEVDVARGEATPAQIEEIRAGHFYTVKQVAAELGYGTAWIISLAKTGRIKAMKPTGGQWRVAESEVERLRTEGIPPLPRKKPEVKATEIPITGKHEERVKATEKKEEATKEKLGFPFNIIFGEEE